jgi:hypothetical protein
MGWVIALAVRPARVAHRGQAFLQRFHLCGLAVKPDGSVSDSNEQPCHKSKAIQPVIDFLKTQGLTLYFLPP